MTNTKAIEDLINGYATSEDSSFKLSLTLALTTLGKARAASSGSRYLLKNKELINRHDSEYFLVGQSFIKDALFLCVFGY